MTVERNGVRKPLLRRSTLALALAVSMGATGLAWGQATTGGIFGTAPAEEGSTIVVTNESGLTREVQVTGGRYNIGSLPIGTYTVTLRRDGQDISSQNNVTLSVGANTQINFASSQGATELGTVTVEGSVLPSIDVRTATPTFTVTSQQLEMLPLGQSADALALMAPGATPGSDYFGGISFAGAGVTENAYYINGFNTTSLYDYTGTAFNLPYGVIDQQQTLTGGYSAKYGRADGGVVNQVGKSGTNEWHFGARLQWVPRSGRADPDNQYYPNVELTDTFGQEQFTDATKKPGDLYRYRDKNKGWQQQLSGYVGGPLVKDRLFAFVAVQTEEQSNRSIGTVTGRTDNRSKNHSTTWYSKIDWNIDDNNLFEYTLLKDEQRNGYGETYRYDYENRWDTDNLGANPYSNYTNKTQIFHYTGYLTDDLTLSVLYGKTEVTNPNMVPDPSELPFISGAGSQDPAITGGRPIINNQTVATIGSPDSAQRNNGLRVDLSWQVGDHLLSGGIDNLHYWAEGQGDRRSGPGYVWIYGRQSVPTDAINTALDVGAPGGNGYFVYKDIYSTVSSMSARQQAWYIQDEWQVTPNVLLSIGLRNDSFANYNPAGTAFIQQDDQYEPRLGFIWDVNGDSTLKIWGNAGRYFLALPQAVANRQATASIYTDEYFTYTGIDSNGEPTGLTPISNVAGTGPAGPVSANGEFGELPDPEVVAAKNIKPQYQDEIAFGFDKTWGDKWVYGGNIDYRTLGTMIDDGCYPYAIRDGISEMGLNPNDYAWDEGYCHLFNPNRTNIYKVNSATGGDPINVPVSAALANLPKAQRDYYALNAYLEHPFDGKWMGRVDYTFSRSWGNSEGQVRSDIGQGDISTTEDWDYAELMDGARGYLSNHIRHQIKAFGAYQITPEWMVSGTATIYSGRPVSCLGFYGPTPNDPATRNPGFGYGSDYHWCEGQIATPGATTTSWTKQVDLGVTYAPAFADNKLAFKMYVFNVFDDQKPTQLDPHRFARGARTVSNTYHLPISYQSPRYVRFTVSYDY